MISYIKGCAWIYFLPGIKLVDFSINVSRLNNDKKNMGHTLSLLMYWGVGGCREGFGALHKSHRVCHLDSTARSSQTGPSSLKVL